MADDRGAYLLHLRLATDVRFAPGPGPLGGLRLPAGRYVYVGSARGGIAARVAHHISVAAGERPGRHWHIDRLLAKHGVTIERAEERPGRDECALCRELLSAGAQPAAEGFGASDCRRGCGTHLLKVASLDHGIAKG